ncbi:MAG: hypothetical protein NZT92_19175 [Abditibacteriales bacterium]|nr:hypothetical protein [Abditibacteriales bacterium]MDW8367925.1 hypothetical protein [Abditibacteriales bacterium]
MTDDEARTVQQHVEGYLRSGAVHGFDIGNPKHFDKLVEQVKSRLSLAGVADDDLRAVTAMCVLGPEFAGIPPSDMREELLNILQRSVPDAQKRLERVMEFAIAYGCGKWRTVQEGNGGWEHQWGEAVRGLVRALEPAVNQSNRWLASHVVGFPQDRDVRSDAHLLAMRLKHPESPLHLDQEETMSITCTDDGTELRVSSQNYEQSVPPGAKAVFTVTQSELRVSQGVVLLANGAKVIVTARDDEARTVVTWNKQREEVRLRVGETATIAGPATLRIWECSRGNVHCSGRHRLEAWDPTQMELWAFVASAVKGPPPQNRNHARLRQIVTGSFVQGMYFPLLAQEGW